MVIAHRDADAIPAKMREGFAKQKQSTLGNPPPVEQRQRYLELRNKVLVALQAAGARLLIGPDSPRFFLVPGFATRRELQSFVEAGLSPYQAIEAATRNPAEYFAEFMKAPRDFGTVEVGMRADLILLEANPPQAVANLSQRAGVMVRGRWLPESELRKMLEHIAALNGPTAGPTGAQTNFHQEINPKYSISRLPSYTTCNTSCACGGLRWRLVSLLIFDRCFEINLTFR